MPVTARWTRTGSRRARGVSGGVEGTTLSAEGVLGDCSGVVAVTDGQEADDARMNRWTSQKNPRRRSRQADPGSQRCHDGQEVEYRQGQGRACRARVDLRGRPYLIRIRPGLWWERDDHKTKCSSTVLFKG